MVHYGKNITAKEDMLQKVPLSFIYKQINQPHEDLKSKIKQLRILRTMNSKQYNQLKKQLPYFVCGIFQPPYRKKENFGYTNYFIIDLDYLSDKEIALPNIKAKITQDPRVVMCFTSPSEDGLKIVFQLKERCYDPHIYSVFYRAFAKNLAKQYQLEQIIDSSTSDVARACFISFDPNTYYNQQAESIDLNQYVDTNYLSAFISLKKELEQNTKETKQDNAVPSANNDPDSETIEKIKAILNPNAKIKMQKPPAYIPQALENIMDDLKLFIDKAGIELTEIINIQYGKKMRFKLGARQAEINLFYGKKGFSVVISPRSGTNEELNKLTSDLILTFLYELK